MNTRTEPAMTALTSLFSARKISNEQLVNDALDSFNKAEEKMNNAISAIDANVKEEQEAIEAAQKRIEQADSAKARLTRVIDRLKALTE
jgi:Asp-tRNA(Asn)/Glu-tRNA(Gln) amidotransferase A subunit family amidase